MNQKSNHFALLHQYQSNSYCINSKHVSVFHSDIIEDILLKVCYIMIIQQKFDHRVLRHSFLQY